MLQWTVIADSPSLLILPFLFTQVKYRIVLRVFKRSIFHMNPITRNVHKLVRQTLKFFQNLLQEDHFGNTSCYRVSVEVTVDRCMFNVKNETTRSLCSMFSKVTQRVTESDQAMLVNLFSYIHCWLWTNQTLTLFFCSLWAFNFDLWWWKFTCPCYVIYHFQKIFFISAVLCRCSLPLSSIPANKYLVKVINAKTRERCKIRSTLTIRT